MSRYERGLFRAFATLLAFHPAGLALAGGPAAPGAEEVAAFSVRVADAGAARSVRSAVAGAHERLGREGCQAIFDVFRDPSGRTLNENLAALDTSGQEFLEQVFFYDGSALPVCQPNPGKEVYAVTERGGRAVRVCARQFEALQRKSPVLGEVVVIHEMLHALGLDERPPVQRRDHLAGDEELHVTRTKMIAHPGRMAFVTGPSLLSRGGRCRARWTRTTRASAAPGPRPRKAPDPPRRDRIRTTWTNVS